MNVFDESSKSPWMETAGIDAPALTSDENCDVAVIGAGIAGLSVAYELARMGRSVVVIDRGAIGTGMSARTTAHLSSELDDRYAELVRVRGLDEARLYYDSQVAAINRIEAICMEEGIDADFARVDGYLFAAEESHRERLEEEFRACTDIGVEVEWAVRAPVPRLDTGPALRFANQARFHLSKYLHGLAKAITQKGGRLYAHTAHVRDRETRGGVEIEAENGRIILAASAVFCTNSPTNDKVAIHTKQVPMRTYAIAGRIPKGSAADALIWDTLDAYHYIRLQPLSESQDLLIVGGEDHRSGTENDMDLRFARLEQWTRERYPDFISADYRWSGQVMEPVDFMPYSGRNPGNRNVYVHTGDSGMGITNAVAGSLTILPLILGEDSRFAPLFRPNRKSAAPQSLAEFIRGQAEAVRNFAEYVTPGEIDVAGNLAPGEGAVVREGLAKVAVYKAEDGSITRHSAACTHMGCIVHWNGFEKCWDCPCHGSQFSPDGQVLNGPAVKPLAAADEPPALRSQPLQAEEAGLLRD